MTPLPELLTSGDVTPSLLGAALRTFAALALLGAGAWAFLRWRHRSPQDRREIRIVDRATLSRGVGLAVVAVADRRLLISVSADGARLLTELDAAEAPAFEALLEARAEQIAETAS